jgi:hypothetical protein
MEFYLVVEVVLVVTAVVVIQTITGLRSVTFRKLWRMSNFAQVGIRHTCGQLHVYIQGSPVKNQTPTRRYLIGRSMTAPLRVLSPSSILPPPASHCAFIPRWKKKSAPVKKTVIISILLVFFFKKSVRLKLRNLKLRISLGVSVLYCIKGYGQLLSPDP